MASVLPLKAVVGDADGPRYDFGGVVAAHGLELAPLAVETLQVNLTALCNQACRHCHVDSSPTRSERLPRAGVEQCLAILAGHREVRNLDITGGAPELHPDFDWFVREAVKLGKQVMVRHNLTVTFDGNPQTGEDKHYLPEFFAAQGVEVISSLPYYQEYFTDAQRGSGTFKKSIEGIRRLNALGYGQEGSGHVLNLVYNPVGPYLPAPQASLQADYKRELQDKFGLAFNNLFTITNMPIHRFRLHLEKTDQFDDYMDKLVNAFNPGAATGVMCRSLISVGWDGRIYDCDFNQQLSDNRQQHMAIAHRNGRDMTVFDFNLEELLARRIRFASHCFGCTAGAGSSCGGATA